MITEVELPVEDVSCSFSSTWVSRATSRLVAEATGAGWLPDTPTASHPKPHLPTSMDPSTLTLAPRLLVLAGDQGRPDALVRQAVANLQAATLITLRDYVSPTIYADVVADVLAGCWGCYDGLPGPHGPGAWDQDGISAQG